MEQSKRFLRCEVCGNMVGQLNNSGVDIYCCEKPMQKLVANKEGSNDKHLPHARVENNQVSVTVGAGEHPMSDKHLIEWIYLETDQGGQRKNLAANELPQTTFAIGTEKPLAVYAYCSEHGLWQNSI